MWSGLLVAAMLAQGLVPVAAQAPETVVRVVSGRLDIRAGTGAANRVVVERYDQAFHVADVVPVLPGPGCEAVATTRVSCRTTGIQSVAIDLGDGDDTAIAMVSLPVNGSGGLGNDGFWGGGANDVLYGGPGNDSIYGNGGADTLYGDGAGSEPACAGDKATCSDILYGQSGPDVLRGGDRGDTLYGGTGADTLDEPVSGANRLDGGPDDDTIIGAGAGMRDMVMYDTRVTEVQVNLSGTPYVGEVLVPPHTGGELATAEHDTITGVHDIWTGSGSDVLVGAGGNPLLNSGPGVDLCDPDGDDAIPPAAC